MSSHLIKYDAAIRALAEAHKVDEVKDIRDKAAALEIYAKQANDKRLLVMASEIKLRAERKAGELLIEMKQKDELAKGAIEPRTKRGTTRSIESTTSKLSDLGISKDQSSDWQKIAQVNPENFNQFLNEAINEGKVVTAYKLLEVVKEKMDEGRLPPEERKDARKKAKKASERIQRSMAIKEALKTFAEFDISPEKAANSNLFMHTEYVVDEYLDDAVTWITDFAEHWRKIRC